MTYMVQQDCRIPVRGHPSIMWPSMEERGLKNEHFTLFNIYNKCGLLGERGIKFSKNIGHVI